jgi:integrase
VVSLPLAAFPKSFQQDLERWRRRLTDPDVFDANAPARPLRASTVESRTQSVLRLASALVRTGTLKVDDVTGLDVLVDVERFKTGIRFFLERLDNRPTPYLRNMANTVRYIAIHYCRVDDAARAEVVRICKRLDDRNPRQLTPRNRERLRQFDDPDKVAQLLAFPQEERARGLAQKNPVRAAKCFERALAVALLIFCTLRMQNLRTIDLRRNLSRAGGKLYLSIDGERVKNGEPLEFEVPNDVAALLEEYVRDHRPKLKGAAGPYLFPGCSGGPRPHNTMSSDIRSALRRRAGLVMNPHLFRHAIAKIVVERDPGLYLVMSRQLGHKRIDMTMAHYLGSETRASGARSTRFSAKRSPTPLLDRNEPCPAAA